LQDVKYVTLKLISEDFASYTIIVIFMEYLLCCSVVTYSVFAHFLTKAKNEITDGHTKILAYFLDHPVCLKWQLYQCYSVVLFMTIFILYDITVMKIKVHCIVH